MLLFPPRPVETLQAFCCFRSLLPAPYHSHSLHVSLTLLTLSLLLPLFSSVFLSLFFLLLSLLLSDLSFSLVRRLHNANQLFRGSLSFLSAYPIRAGLCANGLLLYLLPAPAHSRQRGVGEGAGGIDRGSRRDSRAAERMRGRDKDSEPTQTNRSTDREGKIMQCFSPLLWGAVTDVPHLSTTQKHTCTEARSANKICQAGQTGCKLRLKTCRNGWSLICRACWRKWEKMKVRHVYIYRLECTPVAGHPQGILSAGQSNLTTSALPSSESTL